MKPRSYGKLHWNVPSSYWLFRSASWLLDNFVLAVSETPRCMQHQSSADLLALGSHCSVPACQQIDFLPFTCDCCSNIFCLQHRTYVSHSCQQAGSRDTHTIVCPICAKAVKLNADEDPHAVFDRHTQTYCDPTNYAKVHQRPRCPAKGCREKLGAINTYTCKECSTQVCLKHRFPEDHQCPGKAGKFLQPLLYLEASLHQTPSNSD